MNGLKKTNLIKALLLSSILAVFFLLSTTPVIEGDIFWHIKTGEWIVKHLSIPDIDPFAYTSQKIDPVRPDSVRHDLVLKGYWLSQPLFYLVYDWSGMAGIILLRAFVITLILYVLYAWMKRLGVGFGTSVIVLFLVGYQIKYQGDRPHYFSFLFFPLTAILLEMLRERFGPGAAYQDGHTGPSLNTSRFSFFILPLLLPFMMLIWANMHGGYIMGVALIIVYMAGELFKRGRNALKKVSSRPSSGFYLVSALSIAATLINPVTYKIYPELFGMTREGILTSVVIDYISPFTAMWARGDYKPAYWVLIICTLVILAVRFRQMGPGRCFALIFFAGESLSVQRNIPFFLTLMPLVAVEVDSMMGKRFSKTLIPATACLALLAVLLYGQFKEQAVMNSSLDNIFPVQGADFIRETRPEGNLFNFVDWGGYLILHLPEYKVFDDSRRIMTDVQTAQYNILKGSNRMIAGMPVWRAYLDSYNVDIVLIPPVTPIFQEFLPVVIELYKDKDFALVYSDSLSLVYLRKGRNSRNEEIISKYSLPKRLSLVRAATMLSNHNAGDRKSNELLINELYSLMSMPQDTGNNSSIRR